MIVTEKGNASLPKKGPSKETDSKAISENYNRGINKKGRYVKIVVYSMEKIPMGLPGEGHQPWTFMDEIIILFE